MRPALLERLTFSEANKIAADLVDQFPNLRQSVGGGFLGAIAANLADYPKQVALRAADPTEGVAAGTDWLTISALVKWLDRETEPMRRRAEREVRTEQQFKDRGLTYDQITKVEAANAAARAAAGRVVYDHSQFEDAVAAHGRPIGRWESPGDRWNRSIEES